MNPSEIWMKWWGETPARKWCRACEVATTEPRCWVCGKRILPNADKEKAAKEAGV